MEGGYKRGGIVIENQSESEGGPQKKRVKITLHIQNNKDITHGEALYKKSTETLKGPKRTSGKKLVKGKEPEMGREKALQKT